MDSILLLEQQYPVLLILICFVFGAVIGSFLNVVVYRLPIMMFREMRDEAQEILDLCDRIAIFKRGRVVEVVDAHATTQEELLHLAS